MFKKYAFNVGDLVDVLNSYPRDTPIFDSDGVCEVHIWEGHCSKTIGGFFDSIDFEQIDEYEAECSREGARKALKLT
jgi:hypothetical protein